MSSHDYSKFSKETGLVILGRDREVCGRVVNPPVYRASTVLFDTLEEYEAGEQGSSPYPTYARFGTPSSAMLEQALAATEGADHAIVTSSGLSAITSALVAFLGNGDHLLMVDTVYGPARRFVDEELTRFGVEVTYYDPSIGKDIEKLMKKNTRVVYTESPGSLTFEMQDVPAIATVAHKHGAVVLADNTWPSPLYFKPFDHGVDISIYSATKYVSGHSDLVMGVISCRKKHYERLKQAYRNIGACPAADSCYLALRGLRTMAVRLKQHQETAMELVNWLSKRKEVAKILYPAHPGDAGHAIWKRDMSGASGLFGVLLNKYPKKALAAMLDNLELYKMGFSWGGYESLIIPFSPDKVRTATRWNHDGINLRIHAGLENANDLINDLEAGFKRLNDNA